LDPDAFKTGLLSRLPVILVESGNNSGWMSAGTLEPGVLD
jgi:hypothetical protein